MNWWVVYLVAAVLLTGGVFGAYALGENHGKAEGFRKGQESVIAVCKAPELRPVIYNYKKDTVKARLEVGRDVVEAEDPLRLIRAVSSHLREDLLRELGEYVKLRREEDPIRGVVVFEATLDVLRKDGGQDV